MGKTISEKIIGNKARDVVEAGQIVEANVDYVMVNDVTGLPAFEQFEKFPKGTKPIAKNSSYLTTMFRIRTLLPLNRQKK